MGRTSAKVAAGHREVFRIAWVPIPLIVVYSDDRAGSMSLISVRRVTRSVILPMTIQKANAAAFQNILDCERCSCNALELPFPRHTPHRVARFDSICSR
jgi:hypothetical protein